jgi:hypothetical protein
MLLSKLVTSKIACYELWQDGLPDDSLHMPSYLASQGIQSKYHPPIFSLVNHGGPKLLQNISNLLYPMYYTSASFEASLRKLTSFKAFSIFFLSFSLAMVSAFFLPVRQLTSLASQCRLICHNIQFALCLLNPLLCCLKPTYACNIQYNVECLPLHCAFSASPDICSTCCLIALQRE